jgi:hypothetical protein
VAVTKVLARGWTFEVDKVGTWVPIKGINSFSPSPEANTADTTDFDSAGWNENMVASRGLSVSLEGLYLEDVANGDQDEGQEHVEYLGTLIGPASVGKFRMTSPGGRTKVFFATANVTSGGGGNDDPAAWSAELTVTGQPLDSTATLVTITVLPDAPTADLSDGNQQFTAIGVYSSGQSRDITALVTWTSSTAATATIAPGGLATLVAVGTSTITATLSSISDTSLLTVTT